MRKIKLIPFILISIISSGCTNNMTSTAAPAESMTNNDYTPKVTQQQAAADPAENQSKVISPVKKEENLTFVEYPNLNSENNQKVTMPLKEGWTATRLTFAKPSRFEYNENKNKAITESYAYYIYNEKKEEIGWFSTIGRYNGTDDSSLPNHLQFKSVTYKGMTKFGEGKIYLLQLDPPKDSKIENQDSIREWYAIIPIKNEELAYNFYLKVPYKENPRDTLDIMKDIIVTSDDIEAQVHELFTDEKNAVKNTEKIIELIPYIDWSKYASKNWDEFFKIMKWLGALKVNNEDSMVNILNGTNGLDGVYTDAYSSAVKDLFFNDRDVFLKASNKIDEEQLKQISSFIHYDCSPEEANIVKDYFKNIVDSNNSAGINKERAKLFLDSFK